MTEKSFKMDKDYDVQNDVLYLHIIDDYEYQESVEVENNIIVDFNKDYVPVALEILDASKFLDVSKFSLKNLIKWDMNIQVTEDSLSIKAMFIVPIRQKHVEKPVLAETMNDINLPHMQTHFDLATA